MLPSVAGFLLEAKARVGHGNYASCAELCPFAGESVRSDVPRPQGRLVLGNDR
jgi:hypothetical protein